MFRFFGSKFKNEKSKEKTARVVLWREFNVLHSFTVEASFLGYFDENRATIIFTTDRFELMGKIIGEALLNFINIKN